MTNNPLVVKTILGYSHKRNEGLGNVEDQLNLKFNSQKENVMSCIILLTQLDKILLS